MYLISALLFYYKENNYNSSMIAIGAVSDERGKNWNKDQSYFLGLPMSFDEFADFCFYNGFSFDVGDCFIDSVCIIVQYFEVRI